MPIAPPKPLRTTVLLTPLSYATPQPFEPHYRVEAIGPNVNATRLQVGFTVALRPGVAAGAQVITGEPTLHQSFIVIDEGDIAVVV